MTRQKLIINKESRVSEPVPVRELETRYAEVPLASEDFIRQRPSTRAFCDPVHCEWKEDVVADAGKLVSGSQRLIIEILTIL